MAPNPLLGIGAGHAASRIKKLGALLEMRFK